MKIDYEIEAPGTQAPAKCDVGENVLPWDNDHFIDVWIRRHDRCGRRLDQIAEMSVGKTRAQGTNGRRRKHHVANLTQANQEDPGDLRMRGCEDLRIWITAHVSNYQILKSSHPRVFKFEATVR